MVRLGLFHAVNITRDILISKLAAAGIPTTVLNQFLAPDEVEGTVFGTVADEFVQRVWDGFIAMLRADPNANLTVQRDIGGGKTRTVPNWVSPGAVCRHWAFAFYGYFLLCAMKLAVSRPQANDGYAFAVVYYTAEPRAEDLGRAGRHARMFYVNDAGDLGQFEEGDGDPEAMTSAELASITFNLYT